MAGKAFAVFSRGEPGLAGKLEREIAIDEASGQDHHDDQGVDERVHAPSLASGRDSRPIHRVSSSDSRARHRPTDHSESFALPEIFQEEHRCRIPIARRGDWN